MGTAVLYARFSNKEKEDKVVSLESQLDDERKRAKADGFTVVGEFQDDGFSAYKPKVRRPGWEELLDRVEEGGVDRIYTRDSDRTTRQQNETGMLLALCAEYGVTLVEGGVRTAPDDEDAQDMRRFKSMMDERYSRAIKKGVRRAREKSAQAGRPHPGPRPFGYMDDRRTLHPVEAQLYKELFERVIAGDGTLRIAQDWDRRGVHNRKGNCFSADSIKKLVQSPRAAGKRLHRGEIIGDGDWTPIVTPEIQRQAIAAMKSRRRLRGPGVVRKPRLLSSMVVCAECERPMRVRNQQGQPSQYACDATKSQNCGRTYIKAEPVDAEVEKRLLYLLGRPGTLKRINALKAEQPDVGLLMAEIELLETDLAAEAADFAEGRTPRSNWLVVKKGLTARIEEAKERLEAATDIPALMSIDLAETVEKWDSFDLDEKRRRLDAFVDVVRLSSANGRASKRAVDPERIEVRWRF